MRRAIVPIFIAMLLGGCATTNEMVLAPNAVRLDTNAQGLAFVGSVGHVTMKRAAEATIRRGYTHFRLEEAATSQGRQLAGVQSHGNVWGRGGFYSGTTFSRPVYAPTASVGVTVVMFHAHEPGASGAWDAAEVAAADGRV